MIALKDRPSCNAPKHLGFTSTHSTEYCGKSAYWKRSIPIAGNIVVLLVCDDHKDMRHAAELPWEPIL